MTDWSFMSDLRPTTDPHSAPDNDREDHGRDKGRDRERYKRKGRSYVTQEKRKGARRDDMAERMRG